MTSILGDSETTPTPDADNKQRPWLAYLAAIGLALIIGYVGLRLLQGRPIIGPPRFNAYLMQSPDPMPNFTLMSTDGTPVSLRDFRSKITLIYFGYAYCPDVCPATMAELSKALKELNAREREQVAVVMISVDPTRDTPELLHDYLAFFDPTFVGLVGSDDEIAAAATPFGIYYQKHEGTEASGYLIDHTATVSVLDRDGHLRLVIPFNMRYDAIADDVRNLLRE